MMELFQDPVKMKTYFQTYCEDNLIDKTNVEHISAAFYAKVDLDDLDDDSVLKVCTDKNGAWENYHLCASVLTNMQCARTTRPRVCATPDVQ